MSPAAPRQGWACWAAGCCLESHLALTLVSVLLRADPLTLPAVWTLLTPSPGPLPAGGLLSGFLGGWQVQWRGRRNPFHATFLNPGRILTLLSRQPLPLWPASPAEGQSAQALPARDSRSLNSPLLALPIPRLQWLRLASPGLGSNRSSALTELQCSRLWDRGVGLPLQGTVPQWAGGCVLAWGWESSTGPLLPHSPHRGRERAGGRDPSL